MKKCLRYHWFVLVGHKYLLLGVLLIAVLLGLSAGDDVRVYADRGGQELAPLTALALAFEGRRLVGLFGAAWGYLFIANDFRQRGINMPVYRGCRRLSVFAAKYLLLIGSCIVCSLLMQAASLLTALEWVKDVPAGWLLRSVGLRLLLDLGTMTAPLFVIVLLRGNLSAFVLCAVYGLLLYFKGETNYALWLPDVVHTVKLSALWPIAALPLSGALSCVIWNQAELQ